MLVHGWFSGPFVAADRGREPSKWRAGDHDLYPLLPPAHFFLNSFQFQERTSPLATWRFDPAWQNDRKAPRHCRTNRRFRQLEAAGTRLAPGERHVHRTEDRVLSINPATGES